MKIHYSPHFNGEKYIDFKLRKNLVFDEVFVGDAGLLSELELRAGISCDTLPLSEREANYYSLLKLTLEGRGRTFIDESFKLDAHGVAAELLKWRDELILAGWHHGIRGISEKLDLLADIEAVSEKNSKVIMGDSDRWRKILEFQGRLLEEDSLLLICFPEKNLSPWIKKLIAKLRHQGSSCIQQDYETPNAPANSNLRLLQENFNKHNAFSFDSEDKTSIRILEFESYSQALEYLAANPSPKDTVYINEDNREFDLYQELLGHPVSGSRLKDANPEVIQLFKLGCSLFMSPFNIYNLLSYLQVSLHPLPARLRRELVKVIIEEGGIINEKWDAAINTYLDEDPEDKPNRKNKIRSFLPLYANLSERAAYSDLSEYIKQLRTWANQILIMIYEGSRKESELVQKQLSLIAGYCNAMITILGNEEAGYVDSSLLSSLILSVYKPSDYNNTDPLIGSRIVVNSPAAFADSAENIIWIDTFESNTRAKLYSWLENKEIPGLEKAGVFLWREEEQVEASLAVSGITLNKCKNSLCLISAGKHADKNLHPGPFMVQLKAQVDNINDFVIHNPRPDANTTELKRVELPLTPISLNIGANNGLERRANESYSSLDLLIQYPIDYVLTYNAGLKNTGIAQLAEERRTLGNVAHDFVEALVNETSGEMAAMRNELEQNFSERFESSLMRKGAILLLKENSLLLSRFKLSLRNSVNNLMDIITENQLRVKGCEVEDDMEVNDRFILGAKIDLLLEDKAGKPVIFDLKWTRSKNLYTGLLKENKALQLEIYSKVMSKETGPARLASGYFDIERGRLLSTFPFKGKNIIQITPDSDEDVFKQAINSYDYRWKQFQKGEIEMAENAKLEDIPYHVDSESGKLYPLKPDYNKPKLKSTNSFSEYTTLKGGLK